MNLGRTAAIVLRQIYLLRGSMARVIPIFLWVTIDMVLWGFMTRYLNVVAGSGFNFVSALLGAVLLWDFFTRVMQGITIAFFEDVWARNFLNFFATPMRTSEYVGGLVISSILTSTVGLGLMLLIATAGFGFSFFSYGLALLPFLLVLFLFGIALGIAATAMVLRLGPASEWFVWPIPALLSPFVGVFYPLSVLPRGMRMISYLLPPAHVFEQLRNIVAGRPYSGTALLTAVALAIGYVLLASWCFTRMYKRAVRTGLLVRYSAETIS